MNSLEKKINNYKLFMVVMYSFLYALGIVYFLQPSSLISTGLTGVTQLINTVFTGLNFGLLYLLLNIPGVIIGFFLIGKKFTIYSFLSVVIVTITTSILPVGFITNDIILNCIFAGALMGYSLGGLLRIGASSGGTDFYGIWLYQKFGINFGSITLMINVVILFASIYLFNFETALYTLVSFGVRQIVMNMIYTNNNKLTVWIVGCDLSKVSTFINQKYGRGTSIFSNVEGGYSRDQKEVLMVILNRYEYSTLSEDIFKIAPDVFISANKTFRIEGNYKIKKDLD